MDNAAVIYDLAKVVIGGLATALFTFAVSTLNKINTTQEKLTEHLINLDKRLTILETKHEAHHGQS